MHTQSAGLREFLPDASPTRVDLAPRDVQASGAERGGDTTLAQSEIPGLAQGLVCRAAEAKMAAEDFGHLDEDIERIARPQLVVLKGPD